MHSHVLLEHTLSYHIYSISRKICPNTSTQKYYDVQLTHLVQDCYHFVAPASQPGKWSSSKMRAYRPWLVCLSTSDFQNKILWMGYDIR